MSSGVFAYTTVVFPYYYVYASVIATTLHEFSVKVKLSSPAMELKRIATSLSLRVNLPDGYRAWLTTCLQRISSKDFRVSPQTFQLEFTLDEEEKGKDETVREQEERDERRLSVLSLPALTTRERATSIHHTRASVSDLSNMATLFEESMVMQKRVQVESLPTEEDVAIIAARTRTFVTWINSHLKEKRITIQNLDSDLESGVVLIKLLESLAHGKRIAGRLVHIISILYS